MAEIQDELSLATSIPVAGSNLIFGGWRRSLYIFYMPSSRKPALSSSLMVKVGGWFEASATGWGILAVPLMFVVALVAAYVLATP